MSSRRPKSKPRWRPGVVLPAVLIVVVLLTLAAYQYSDWVTAELQAADSFTRAGQARAAAASGIYYAAGLLSNPSTLSSALGNNPYSNPTQFQGVIVRQSNTPKFQSRFSLVAPLDPALVATGAQPYWFGVTDECGKINLNALMQIDSSGQTAYNALMLLPNMTSEVANAILDWLDPDDDPRAGGAENSTYQSLNPGYSCKNGPLDSIEELLLVSGVTPQLLLGNDRNRNGMLDAEEDDGTGVLDRGWSAYLTVHSRERNIDSTNAPRIYINSSDMATLYTNLQTTLSQDLANFILAARLYGLNTSGGASGSGGSGSGSGGSSGSGSGNSGGNSGGSGGGGGSGGSGMSGAGGGGSGGSGMSGSGGSNSSNSSNSGTSAAPTTDLGQIVQAALANGGSRGQSISSLYSLINSTVTVPASSPNTQAQTYPSPLNDPGVQQQYLPIILDKLTTQNATEIPARININTAPEAVLYTLPSLQPTDVQTIIAMRPNPASGQPTDPSYLTPAWLVTLANLSPSTLSSLEQYITGRSQVYRVQAVGHFDGGGPTARIEAVIDTNGGRPRITYWRDLTEVGKGYQLPLPN